MEYSIGMEKQKWYEGSIRKMLSNFKKHIPLISSLKKGLRITELFRNIMWKKAILQLLIRKHGRQYSLKDICKKAWTV